MSDLAHGMTDVYDLRGLRDGENVKAFPLRATSALDLSRVGVLDVSDVIQVSATQTDDPAGGDTSS